MLQSRPVPSYMYNVSVRLQSTYTRHRHREYDILHFLPPIRCDDNSRLREEKKL